MVYNPNDVNFEENDNNVFVNWYEVYPSDGQQSGSTFDAKDGTNSVCIRSVKAILVNETMKEKIVNDLKKKTKFMTRFPRDPYMHAFCSSPHNINNSGYYCWRAFPQRHMFASYNGFGVTPDWNSIYKPLPKRSDVEYIANAAATSKQNIVEVMFPAEHQLHTGVYSLIIIAKLYAPGYNAQNLRTITIDVPNVFELVKTSQEGMDTDMYIDVSALLDKLPEDQAYVPDAEDIYVRHGWVSNDGENVINLNRTDDSTIQVNLDSITGWYEEEDL